MTNTAATKQDDSARQQAEAAHLRALYNDKKGEISQEEFGARYEIGSQGMIWQYLNGRRPLNLKAAIGFARGLRVPLEDVSPTIAEQVAIAWKLCGTPAANVSHSGIPDASNRNDLPDEVDKALQSVLTAFRRGMEPSFFNALTIFLYALTPRKSGNIAGGAEPRLAERTVDAEETRARMAEALKGTRVKHGKHTEDEQKKRRQS